MVQDTKKKEISEDPVKVQGEREIRDNYIPVSESDLAQAVDVPVKTKITEEIEKQGKLLPSKLKKSKKSKSKKIKKSSSSNFSSSTKSSSKSSKTKSKKNDIVFNVTPKKLSISGPILIITEKPQAAQKIASALAQSKIITKTLGGVNYYYFTLDHKEVNVVCAVGHLFTLAQVQKRSAWPTFDIRWLPNYMVRKKDFTKKYYETISKMSKNVSEVIVATDYDIEGEVIGMNIIKYICGLSDAKRMHFSTLTASEIKKSFDERLPSLDWKQGVAGETRHYIDWIYGINLSRALMDAIKTTGKFRLMSIGRVQGPALNIIVKREKEILSFKPSKYWDIFLDVNDNKNKLTVKYNKDITKEKDLGVFKNLKGKKALASTIKSNQKVRPPTPFDLTSLQTESYKFYKITPSKTLEIAQRLYLMGAISYPRTSSQKIPHEIGYENILKRLANHFDFVKKAKNKTPIEGKKSDPAHPSIYPTGEFHKLDEEDFKIYSLIVRRFVSCFCDDALIDNKKINVEVDNLKFSANGVAINKKGWMDVYPYQITEKEIPDMEGEVNIDDVSIQEKYTQPPHRYTPASLLTQLEKKNLGTKATRANILETLYDRNYIKDKSITATSLGISLIDSLDHNCPIIIDEKLTRDVENHLEQIRNSKDLFKKQQQVLNEVKKIIFEVGEQFKINKEKIGHSLVDATTALWESEKKESEVMPCPSCKKGNLSIKYAKQYNRFFLGCSNYPECRQTFTLPPNGLIKKADKICSECNYQMLMSLKKGKRPWIFCFNPVCPSRKEKENKESNEDEIEE